MDFITYNCKHFRDSGPKFEFISNLAMLHNIILLQEHCLYSSEFYKLAKVGNGYGFEAVSAMNDGECRVGRPYGGCAILWNPNMNFKVKGVPCNNRRLCAILLENGCSKILLFNAYMPCDGADGFEEYCDVLDCAAAVIEKVNVNHVVFGGDFNTDIARNTRHVRKFKQFVADHCLCICTDAQTSDVPYTYVNYNNHTSKIDHFLISDSLSQKFVCKIIDNHLHSDHVPLLLSLDFDVSYISTSDKVHVPRVAWHKANNQHIVNYQTRLNQNLSNIVYDVSVLHCNDHNCHVHCKAIESLYVNILDACIDASRCIPHTSPCGQKVIAGWNDEAEQLKREALSWHKVWKESGRPHSGDLAEIHRMSRARYHRVVRQLKKNANSVRMQKMVQAISNNDSRKLWSEVRKFKGKCNIVTSSIDNVSDKKSIANLFGKKYNDLYNSVSYDADLIGGIENKIANLCIESGFNYNINVSEVANAVKKLKGGKSGGCEDILSDNIINGTHQLFVWLSVLFNAMIVHGYSPSLTLFGLLIPIPKDKRKSLCQSDNYRAIALSSVICKVFDLVILHKESDKLCSNNMQFGFKEGVSTTQCTFSLLETVNYYKFHNSQVYALFLDASKAFDRIEYTKLFNVLIERKVSPLVLRTLFHMYRNQKLKVKWENVESQSFVATNGVKQGGILSPILFAVYVDGLLSKLKKSGFGCHVRNEYIGALSFADDITLMAPTLFGLQKMVEICESYATEYSIKFNASKSKFLCFNVHNSVQPNVFVLVNGEKLAPSESVIHLGHLISHNNVDCVVHIKNNFWRSFNMFNADLGALSPDLKSKLFVQYCCSFYGATLLNLFGCNDIFVAWRKALRCIWNVHPQTHGDLLCVLSGMLPIQISLYKRFCKFISNCLNSKNSIVKTISSVAICNPYSVCCKNYHKLFDKTSKCKVSMYIDDWQKREQECLATSSMVLELIKVRNGGYEMNGFDSEEVNDLLTLLCIM